MLVLVKQAGRFLCVRGEPAGSNNLQFEGFVSVTFVANGFYFSVSNGFYFSVYFCLCPS